MIRALLRRRVRAAGGGGGGGGGTVANYAALPNVVLTQQQPNWAFWVANVRNAAAGTAYTDPISGMRGVKLTSATVPNANAGIRADYSSGGPFISAPWGTNGNSVTVWAGTGLCDITRGGVPTNYREPVVAGGELRFGFSRNPATPRRAYVMGTDGYLRRINTETNTLDPGQGFPYDLRAFNGAFFPLWITVSENDTTISVMASDTTFAVAVRPATQTVLTKTLAEINAANGNFGLNEPYVSADGRYVLLMGDNGAANGTMVWDLETGFLTAPFLFAAQNRLLTHGTSAGGGRFVQSNPVGSRMTSNIFTCVPVLANGQAFPIVDLIFPESNTSPGFGHNNSYQVGPAGLSDRYVVGQGGAGEDVNANAARRGPWSVHTGQIYRTVLNEPSFFGIAQRGPSHTHRRATNSLTAPIVATTRRATSIVDMTEDSWFWDQSIFTLYLWCLGGGEPNAVYGTMFELSGAPANGVSAFRIDGNDGTRLLGHQYSSYEGYSAAGFSQQSYDGKWVMFSTDHGVPNGRNDVLILELPVI